MGQMISDVGFPIFCVVALAYFMYKTFVQMNAQNLEREKVLYKMLDDVRDELNRATEINAGFMKVLENFQEDLNKIQSDISDIKVIVEAKRK